MLHFEFSSRRTSALDLRYSFGGPTSAIPLQEEAANMISAAIGKVVDRLPLWGKVIFYILTLVGSVYLIAQYGFFHFLLRVIFSP